MSDRVTDELVRDLDADRAVVEAATQGEWKCWNGWGPIATEDDPLKGCMGIGRIGPDEHNAGVTARPGEDFYALKADAEFIATFDPPTVRWYIETLVETRAKLQIAREQVVATNAACDRAVVEARAERDEFREQARFNTQASIEAEAERDALRARLDRLDAPQVREGMAKALEGMHVDDETRRVSVYIDRRIAPSLVNAALAVLRAEPTP